MSKTTFIKMILPTAAIIFGTMLFINYLYSRPLTYKSLLEDKETCVMLSSSLIDQSRCYHNSLKSIYSGQLISGLESIQHLCLNGFEQACFTRDLYNTLHNSTGYSLKIENYDNDLKHCLFNVQDESFNSYYCQRLIRTSKAINDESIPRILEIEKCFRESNCNLSHKPQDVLIPFKVKEEIKKRYCLDEFTQTSFCIEMKNLIRVEKSILKNEIPSVVNLINIYCNNQERDCSNLLNTSYVTGFIFRNISSIASKIPISHIRFNSLLPITQKFAETDENALSKTSDKRIKLLILAHKKQFSDIREICQNETVEGCVLQFSSNYEIANNMRTISQLCARGDDIACKIEIFHRAKLNEEFKYEVSPIYWLANADSVILKQVSTHPTFRIRTFINNYRYHLMSVVALFIIAFQIYILILFRKLDITFSYLRKKQAEEIKSKIQNIINAPKE